jgi:glycolate oxidase FAD binding subunit
MQAMDSAQSQLIQITERVRAAAADAVPLRIRGGGTKDFHGLALQGELLTRGRWPAWSATSPANWS